MSQLLMLKSFGKEYLTKSVKQVEKYLDSNRNANLKVEVSDDGLRVYDSEVLLLNIRVVI